MNNPKITIGLPVYNGEPFISETIDAILNQTYRDFELIISDNASTDATEQICKKYAAQDDRISYDRNQHNIGATGNFNRVFRLASGEYLKWAAHDDLLASDYLAKCIEVLDRDRSIVLCHSQVQIINEQGKFLSDYNIKLRTDSNNPATRFHALLSHYLCYPIFGLIRSSTLRQTSLMGNYGHTDGVLLASIALQGRFYEIPQPLFFSRKHPQQSMSRFFPEYLALAKGDRKAYPKGNRATAAKSIPDYYAYAAWFDPINQGRAIFPHWRIFWEYCRCIWQASLSIKERIGCYLSMFKQLKGLEFLLLKDLVVATRQSLSFSHLRETLVTNANPK